MRDIAILMKIIKTAEDRSQNFVKKSLLAAAVAGAAAFACTAVSAATVYDKDGTSLAIGGRVEAMWQSTHTNKTADRDNTIRDRVRLNLTGRTKLAEGIYGFGFWETQNQHNGNGKEGGAGVDNTNLRQAYVGVDFTKYGKFTVGRTTEPLNWVSDLSGGHFEEEGHLGSYFTDCRNSGHINYTWSGFGFTAGVDYQAAVDGWKDNYFGDSFNVESGFTVVAGYTSPVVLFAPISIRAGYRYLNGQGEDVAGEGTYAMDDMKGFQVAASWGTWGNGFYIGAGYSAEKITYVDDQDDTKFKAWETVVGYGFGNGVNVRVAYAWHSLENWSKVDVDGKKDAGVVPVIVSWDINSNFRVWAEANIEAGGDDEAAYWKDDGGSAASVYHIGVRYTF